uniref:Retrotransposon gag domain-containing protein n=1 Tax=Phytophthora ramorum TaxID=164328 RepID=H3H530_PHYRM
MTPPTTTTTITTAVMELKILAEVTMKVEPVELAVTAITATEDSEMEAAPPASNQTEQDDDLEDMDWWEALTPRQQRAMMKRFLVQPPAATPVPQPVVIQAPPPPATERRGRHKMKRLNLEDFKGTSGESVEAWLATIPQEVERQAGLGGDTWTAAELYYGATAHLKDGASKWLITLSESMREEDKNLAYLVKMMRKKYGRRENLFRIQQRLAARVQQPGERLNDFAASLTVIGFGKRVPAESYIEAFINGINNENTATQVRTYEPQTLDEAVQFAEDKWGEFGEGFKVTDWRVAKHRYRDDREYGIEDDNQPAKKKQPMAEGVDRLDWKKLGLGFGGSNDSPPNFDTEGKAVSGLAKTAKKDPLSLAALQALMLVAGLGREDNGQAASSKAKVARALEIKSEEAEQHPQYNQRRDRNNQGSAWQPQHRDNNSGSYGGGGNHGGGYSSNNNDDSYSRGNGSGFGGRGVAGGRGFGRGRGGRGGAGGLDNYRPPDARAIAQRKAESNCGYCGTKGHWWQCPDEEIQNRTPAKVMRDKRRRCWERVPTVASAGGDGTDPLSTMGGQTKGKSGSARRQNQGKSDQQDEGKLEESRVSSKPQMIDTNKENEKANSGPTMCMPIGTSIVAGHLSAMSGKNMTAPTGQRTSLPAGMARLAAVMSGGPTTAAKRRQRKAEGALAATHGVLAAEVRERREERAKVLRMATTDEGGEETAMAKLKWRQQS